MRKLNWSHAIIGFLIGVSLVLYLRGGSKDPDHVQDTYEVVEVQTE